MSDSPRNLWAKILARLSAQQGRPNPATPQDSKYHLLVKVLAGLSAVAILRWSTVGLTWSHPTATWAS